MANSSKDPGAISLVRADHVEARRKRRLSRGVILRLHIGIIATVVLSMPFGRPLAAAEPADGVTIHINALACHELRTAADLELWVFGKPGSARAIVPNVRHERANWYWVTFILEPGDYMVSLTTTGCGDNFDLTVLPGKARTVASFMHKGGLLYHNRGSISGALPFSAVNIFARCDAEGSDPLRDIPAVIDGGAYYLNNLPDCSYHLFASLAFAQIKFSLHKDISVTRQFQHHIFDISLDMVNAAAKAALPPGCEALSMPARSDRSGARSREHLHCLMRVLRKGIFIEAAFALAVSGPRDAAAASQLQKSLLPWGRRKR